MGPFIFWDNLKQDILSSFKKKMIDFKNKIDVNRQIIAYNSTNYKSSLYLIYKSSNNPTYWSRPWSWPSPLVFLRLLLARVFGQMDTRLLHGHLVFPEQTLTFRLQRDGHERCLRLKPRSHLVTITGVRSGNKENWDKYLKFIYLHYHSYPWQNSTCHHCCTSSDDQVLHKPKRRRRFCISSQNTQ